MAITNKDVEKLKEVFVTKEEFKNELTKLATKDDLRELKDVMLNRLDKIIGEQEKAREDRVFAKAKDDEQDRRLDKLEAKVGV